MVEGMGSQHRAMLMILDGLTRDRHEVVRGAYSVLGAAVPIVGGCAADNLTYAMTQQFCGTGAGVERLSDSVVAVGLGSNGPLGVGLAHGWHKQGKPMVVTSSEEGEVLLLNNEPALDVYVHRIGAARSLLDDQAKFREVVFNHPLGLSRGNGEDIRVIYNGNAERGSVSCLADVPQGGLVWTMKTDDRSLIGAAVMMRPVRLQSERDPRRPQALCPCLDLSAPAAADLVDARRSCSALSVEVDRGSASSRGPTPIERS